MSYEVSGRTREVQVSWQPILNAECCNSVIDLSSRSLYDSQLLEDCKNDREVMSYDGINKFVTQSSSYK